jgi:dienelactone hydrolase
VVLFHHAQGLTPGVVAFAGELRRAGHTVHTPDLFEGHTFATIEEGMGYAEQIGFPGEVIAGDAKRIKEVTDIWTFAREVASRDPNWKLIATQAAN